MAQASPDSQWKPKVNPWIIASTVALAAFMEVLDSSIANVALPHISGGRQRPRGHGSRSGDGAFRTAGCAGSAVSSALGGDARVIVVSGLARSGTSLMMQILAAAGVPIQQDAMLPARTSDSRF